MKKIIISSFSAVVFATSGAAVALPSGGLSGGVLGATVYDCKNKTDEQACKFLIGKCANIGQSPVKQTCQRDNGKNNVSIRCKSGKPMAVKKKHPCFKYITSTATNSGTSGEVDTFGMPDLSF